jgi:putative ATP-dependent endonuclease of the OLD family
MPIVRPGVFISRVVIRNFRNFSECDVRLDRSMTCLVGVNGAGKSNFLDAIRICIDRDMSANRFLTAEDFHKQTGPAEASQVLVSLEFSEVHSSTNSLALVHSWLFANGTKARLTYRFIPKTIVRDAIQDKKRQDNDLTIDDYQYFITGGNDDDPLTLDWSDTYGLSVRDNELQAFQVVALQALRDVTRDLRLQRMSPLQRLISATGLTFEQQKRIVDILSAANAQIKGLPELGSLAAAIEMAYREIGGEAANQAVTIGVADPSFRAFLRSLSVLLSDLSISEYDMYRNSLGSNNLIYAGMVLEVLRRRVAKVGSGGELLIIEEPEAHLHPQAQRAIIRALQRQPFQVIVSTHSPVVSNHIGLEKVIAFDRQPTGASRTIALSEVLQPGELADLNRYLDPHRGTMLFAERVLLVEGAAEEILIPILLKAENIDVDWGHISIIPVHGTHFAAFEALFSEKGLRKRCATIRDGDQNQSNGSVVALYDDGTNIAGAEQSAYLRTFSNKTTFEVAITQPPTVGVLANAIELAGYAVAAQRLRTAVVAGAKWDSVQLQVLRASIRIGKARFAQLVAKDIEMSGFCPGYIKEAVVWLQGG